MKTVITLKNTLLFLSLKNNTYGGKAEPEERL